MVQGKALSAPGRIIFLRLESGARLPQAIDEELRKQGIGFAMIQGIGGLKWARLAVFSPEEKKYYSTDVEPEPGRTLELLSLSGNSVLGPDNTYYTHIHAVTAAAPGKIYGGHVIEAEVDPLAEIFIIELTGRVEDFQRLLANRWGGE